jgi:hypothetical protein
MRCEIGNLYSLFEIMTGVWHHFKTRIEEDDRPTETGMRDQDPAREARDMLGVPVDADPAQIVRAYRRRARIVHPDVSSEPDAGAQFAALWAAYQLLLEGAPEPSTEPDRDEQAAAFVHVRRRSWPAPGPVWGRPAGRTGGADAWLVAGPVRVEPPREHHPAPGSVP